MKKTTGNRVNFEEFLTKIPSESHAITTSIRELIASLFPSLDETVKLCKLEYKTDQKVASVNPVSNYVNIFFWRGNELKDTHKLLQGKGHTLRYLKVTDVDDSISDYVVNLFKQALNLKKLQDSI